MKTHSPDYLLVSIIFGLLIFGLVALASASVVLSQNLFDQSYYFLKHQLFFGLPLGLIAFFVFSRINYQFLKKAAFPLIIAGIISLGLILVPGLGYGHSEANRWLNIGFLSIQPFEFVKLAFIIYLAGMLSKEKDPQKSIKRSLIPFAIIFGVIAILLALQPNMSAIVIISALAGLTYFLAGINISYLFAMLGLAIVAFFALIKTAPYRMSRLTVYLHPEIDPQGIGYQINQALLAIGSGGLFGLGLGHSIQKWQYLPEPIGDSIFAIIAEEWGLIGAGIVVFAFIALAWQGIKIAKRAPDRFGFLLAGAITGWIFLQAFINIAAICGLIPLTGMPLPFISYGGSALAICMAGAGILVNISKHTK